MSSDRDADYIQKAKNDMIKLSKKFGHKIDVADIRKNNFQHFTANCRECSKKIYGIAYIDLKNEPIVFISGGNKIGYCDRIAALK